MGDDAIRTIGTLRETSLHAALKTWYACPGDELEASVEGYQIDLRRGAQLVEIQTRNFAALKRKLTQLVERHPVRRVHPIAHMSAHLMARPLPAPASNRAGAYGR